VSSGSRLRIRSRFTRFGLAVSAVAVAAGAAVVAAWPHVWLWVVVVVSVTAAGVAAAQPNLAAAQQRWADTARVFRSGLQGTRGRAGNVLPLAAEADLGARVHRAVFKLPYVHRDAEDEVRLHLTAGRPVLLVGSSMVGKTRMAGMLIRDMFPVRGVVVPDTREALASLDAADVVVRDSVIFLDDINRLVGVGGITDGALHRLVAAGNIVIGTIRAAEYDRFQPTDQLRPPEWDVLSAFERVFIPRDLSEAEQQRLAEAVSDPGIRMRIQQVGLGEYAGAAERIAEALRLGPSVNPAGFALVLGAADWQRAGMSAPVPALVLPDLAAPYLPVRHRADLSNGDACRAALAWATRDINPTVALLQQTGPDAYVVYDYALDLLSKQTRPVPDSTWPILLHHADPPDLLSIGHSTYAPDKVSEEAWSKAIDSGDIDAAPRAAGYLGFRLWDQGDAESAKVAFQRAIDSGHANMAAIAADALGHLLMQRGDAEGAKAAYQHAIDSGHYDQAPSAAVSLGIFLMQQGDAEGAKAAYQQAIDSGHPDMGPAAADSLGHLLMKHGDTEGAKAAFQQAIDSGHPDVAPIAALRLAYLLEEQGMRRERKQPNCR
jgi:tetratricopeptide (TPR) repeat protein